MNRIREYRPGFVCPEDPYAEVDFETLDELLAIPWVARWAEPKTDTEVTAFVNDGTGHFTKERRTLKAPPPFHRFSISDGWGQLALMAELDEGYSWYVIGFLSSPESGLPEWKPKYRSKN